MPGSLLVVSLLAILPAPSSPGLSPSAASASTPIQQEAASSATDGGTHVSVPGDGLGLVAVPTPRSRRERSGGPYWPVGGAGLGGVAVAGAVLARRRTRVRDRSGQSPIFVYVPGHGGDPDGFSDIADRIGIESGDLRVFDYRWAWPSGDRIEASRRASTGDAADALSAYLAALGEDGRPIYLVGHSKGGAVITEVVARWDAHPEMRIAAVTGTTILDPPIAAGPLGVLQSIGWFHSDTADDGMFDPIRCGWNGCRDVRNGLGGRSGVEVVMVRNPDARFTNFWGDPDGVRVYDLHDGSGDMLDPFPNLPDMWRRMGEAHNSVLHSDVVADCIAAEAAATGSCEWPGGGPTEATSRILRGHSRSWRGPPRR